MKRKKIQESTITAWFPCDCKLVWDIVTDNHRYAWRSDLSKIEVIDEQQFDEYTKSGFVTHFRITGKEPYREYRFTMENDNMSGSWVGKFEQCKGGTQITFTEEVQGKKSWMNLFVKGYLKKQQKLYLSDLKKAVEDLG